MVAGALLILISLSLLLPAIDAFSFGSTISSNKRLSISLQMQQQNTESVSIEEYQHKDFKLTYLFKKAAAGRENDPPIILIHPVGIGLSSWFWKKILDSYDNNPAIYAPDLIGCGIDHGANAWYPDMNGLFFPLSWVEGVETLMNTIVIPRWKEGKIPFFRDNSSGCLVVAQGGLAPVGIMLAKRNTCVSDLMLTSPPTYSDITTAIPQAELTKNYNFLSSPILGRLAFTLLESGDIIKFFSNLFLFQDKCDEDWLDEAEKELCEEARPPVQAFNAGLLQHRSFKEELRDMTQPLWIVSGEGDKRVKDRQSYQSELGERCKLISISGLNVLPYENPEDVVKLIQDIGY